jgi:hypothetical protein
VFLGFEFFIEGAGQRGRTGGEAAAAGDGVLVDIETEIEGNGFRGVVV